MKFSLDIPDIVDLVLPNNQYFRYQLLLPHNFLIDRVKIEFVQLQFY